MEQLMNMKLQMIFNVILILVRSDYEAFNINIASFHN
jgi:hypothetical protein